jgi:hypothetical protein
MFFCSLCYIQCVERFHDDDIQYDLDYLIYDFTRSEDIYNGFANREMGCTDHIDYFSLCLMDDDQIVRKLLKTYLDCVIGSELSEGYKVILPSRLSMSIYQSVLHYQSFLGTSHFLPSAIFHPLPFFTISYFTPPVILLPQSLYIVIHFAPPATLQCKPFYNISNITQSVILYLKSFYSLSHVTL